MLYIVQAHWLGLFGALAFGIVVGWLAYRRSGVPWTLCLVAFVIAALAIAVLAVSGMVLGRNVYRLESAVLLAGFFATGCFAGGILRDLAEFMPKGAAPSAPSAGFYLFRDAFAGMGAEAAYMRRSPAGGGLARAKPTFRTTSAPAAGGYTFPETLPFAGLIGNHRPGPSTGPRRHWSWPRPLEADTDAPAPHMREFTGSKGGYVFPVAAEHAVSASVSREGTTRAGS